MREPACALLHGFPLGNRAIFARSIALAFDNRPILCFAALTTMVRSKASFTRTSARWFLVVLCLTICAGAAGPKTTQPSGPAVAEAAQAQTEEPVDAGSPRAALAEYLRLCRAGDYEDAARYMDVPAPLAKRAPILARRLKAVIDRHVWLDLDSISPLASGDANDGLPPAYEAVAKIPIERGPATSMRLFHRAATLGPPVWVFSRNTIEHIDGWYYDLPQRWQLEHFPSWLLRPGPKELLVWQWIAFPLLFVLAWGLGELLSNLTRRLVARVAPSISTSPEERLLTRLRSPLALIWTFLLVDAALPLLGLYEPAEQFVGRLVRGGCVFALFWSLSRSIDVWGKRLAESAWAKGRASAKSLVSIGVRLAKILLLVVAVVVLVTAMGYPAASIVAGLGVGGLAVALAAQKTLENLLGAFTLGVDQPFQIGDFVKVEDVLGTVESIGLRSTRIRTPERTLITIPNGRLSELRLESYAARDRIRLACNLGLVYGTTVAQIRAVLDGCDKVLREHPKIWSNDITVRLKELGDSALIIEIQAWFETVNFAEFQRIREDTLLAFMTVVESAGTSLAFPSQTIYVSSDVGSSHLAGG
jgi:MscS family membrane protein